MKAKAARPRLYSSRVQWAKAERGFKCQHLNESDGGTVLEMSSYKNAKAQRRAHVCTNSTRCESNYESTAQRQRLLMRQRMSLDMKETKSEDQILITAWDAEVAASRALQCLP